MLRWFTSIDKVDEAAIPDMSETKAYKERPIAPKPGDDGFMSVPDEIDAELPFN